MAMTPYHFLKEYVSQKVAGCFSHRSHCMHGRRSSESGKGFALLIAVIFMSVMLTFGLALGSLGYKQQVLASSAIASQYAFYVADAALECALRADQQENAFAYNPDIGVPIPSFLCDNSAPFLSPTRTYAEIGGIPVEIFWYRLPLDSGKHCADVTIYKYSAPQPPNDLTTYLFSQGYDVSCATVANPDGARFASRGLSAYY